MRKLPEITCRPAEIYDLLYGQVRAALLLAGIELGVFDHLDEPASAVSVAEAIGGHRGNTGLLLDGLTAVGLLCKKDGLYRNGDLAQTYLVKGTETYLAGQMTPAITGSLADGLTAERTKPELRVLENVTSALVGQDMYFDQGFIADALLRMSFRSVRPRTVDSAWGPMYLDIARK